MIVLDTNVLSELMNPKGSRVVYRWVANQSIMSLFTTTVTQAEVLYGIALLHNGQRRDALTQAAQQMFEEDFSRRILSFDSAAAAAFAQVAATRRQIGSPISQLDAQIAGICLSRGAQLATRNVSDFQECGIAMINPWNS
ncbi:MAG: type II toxin-antitoxin system VapC family toxin [Thermosynechococcaceae cyanobacterium MS004]|nr:type II toxin-antitoxin system VapC family toxin [Thermosynechococcaceae cyanobacterium MS004]